MIVVDVLACTALFVLDLALFVLLPRRQADGWAAVVSGVFAVVYGLLGFGFLEFFCGGWCAWSAWSWWRHGGGGGTKRRLRALRRAFRGVRRTAPAYGGAS